LLGKALRLSATVLVTILGLLIVTFLIGRVVPVDPVLAVVGDRASQTTYDRVFVELGLDRPLYVQFGLYVEKALTGDFGESVLTKRPILDISPAGLSGHGGTRHGWHHHRHAVRNPGRGLGGRAAG
jgi:peptide/nickel transport system permease protein